MLSSALFLGLSRGEPATPLLPKRNLLLPSGPVQVDVNLVSDILSIEDRQVRCDPVVS